MQCVAYMVRTRVSLLLSFFHADFELVSLLARQLEQERGTKRCSLIFLLQLVSIDTKNDSQLLDEVNYTSGDRLVFAFLSILL